MSNLTKYFKYIKKYNKYINLCNEMRGGQFDFMLSELSLDEQDKLIEYAYSLTAFIAYNKDNDGLFDTSNDKYYEINPYFEHDDIERRRRSIIDVIVTLPDGSKKSMSGTVKYSSENNDFIIVIEYTQEEKIYDAQLNNYVKTFAWMRPTFEMINEIAKFVPRDEYILEIGAGWGLFAQMLTLYDVNVIATEPNPTVPTHKYGVRRPGMNNANVYTIDKKNYKDAINSIETEYKEKNITTIMLIFPSPDGDVLGSVWQMIRDLDKIKKIIIGAPLSLFIDHEHSKEVFGDITQIINDCDQYKIIDHHDDEAMKTYTLGLYHKKI